MQRRAISPVIATIIIVAVTIAIAIAVAGWLMGLWGSYGTVEQLTVMPDSALSTDADGNAVLTLHVKNTGSKSAVITKVEVVGLGTAVSGGTDTTGTFTSASAVVSQGTDVSITITLDTGSNTYSPGTQYLVKVYTDSGNVYQGFVVAS